MLYKLPMRFKRFLPVIFIVIVWVIFAHPYFFSGLVPFPSRYQVSFFAPWSAANGMAVKNNAMPDVITQIYPWKHLTINTWKDGQIPLWNPYSFSGTVHAANYQSAVFTPLNALFFLLPEIEAWSLLILFQPLFAGFFMYIFLRSLNRSMWASVLGAASFMFAGFMTVWMAYGTLVWAIVWLPLALFAIVMYLKHQSFVYIVLLVLTVCFSFLSGHFQISMYFLVSIIAFLLFEVGRTKRIKYGIKLFIAIIIALCLSAPQIMPAIDAYRESVRSELFTQSGGISWKYLITIFAPDFYGNPVTRNDWYGYYAEWASFIGVIPLLLAIYTFMNKKTSLLWFFIILGTLSLLSATPSFLNTIIFSLKIPAISTSYAARIIILTSFSLIVLSAFGLDNLLKDISHKKGKQGVFFCTTILFILGLIWSVVLFVPFIPADKLVIAKRNLLLPSIETVIFLGIIFVLYFLPLKAKYLFVVGIISLTAFDMVRFASKWHPFDPEEFVYPKMAVLEYLEKNVGANRVMSNFGNEVSSYFALPALDGYDAVYQKRYGEFISSVRTGEIGPVERSLVRFPKDGAYAEKVVQLLGVKYYAHRLSDGQFSWAYPYWNFSHYKSVYRDSYYEVFENERVLPRAYFVSSYDYISVDQEIINKLFASEFNMRDSVILEEVPDREPQKGDGTIEVVDYTPNEIILNTESESDKLLVLSDVFDKGWKATVDQVSTKIYRANYDFRAISVPKGKHTIKFRYWPESFEKGIWLFFVGFFGIVVWGVVDMYTTSRRIKI